MEFSSLIIGVAMIPLFVLAAILTLAAIALFHRDHDRAERRSLIEAVLRILSEKLPGVKIAEEPHVAGTLIQRVQIKNPGLSMIYTKPVEDNALGLPHVLSGTMRGVLITFHGHKFSYVHFEIVRGKVGAEKEAEGLSYEITLHRVDARPLVVKGLLDKMTLEYSTCFSSFEHTVRTISERAQ